MSPVATLRMAKSRCINTPSGHHHHHHHGINNADYPINAGRMHCDWRVESSYPIIPSILYLLWQIFLFCFLFQCSNSHCLNAALISSLVHSISTRFSSSLYNSRHTVCSLSNTCSYRRSHSLHTSPTSCRESCSSSDSPKCFSMRLRSVSILRLISFESWPASNFFAVLREYEGRAAMLGPELF